MELICLLLSALSGYGPGTLIGHCETLQRNVRITSTYITKKSVFLFQWSLRLDVGGQIPNVILDEGLLLKGATSPDGTI